MVVTRPTITVIFWNIWEQVQSGQRDDGAKLLARFDRLIEHHDPDVFGLNEVLVNRKTKASPVLDYFKKRGYYTHFAAFSPMSETWMIGSAFISKQKPAKITDHELGPDTQARKTRGYHGYHVKAIEAHLTYDTEDVAIVVNYLAALFFMNWSTHVTHRKSYEKVLDAVEHRNIIVGGDFNETKYMAPWLRVPAHLEHRTGSLRNPTWRWNGQKRRIAQANYDKMLWTTNGSLRLKTFKILSRQPSDHSPLLGVFTVRDQK
jgi:endonuclease/exonuclease/phosphatase (EEP) superfamily protein YafD